MKNQVLKTVFALAMGVSVLASTAAFAEETELTEAAGLSFEVDGTSYEAADETGLGISEITVASYEAEATTEEDADAADENLYTVELTAADGTVYTIEAVDLDGLKDISFTERFGFVYINGVKEDESKVVVGDNAAEKDLEKSETLYTISRVNIREKANSDAEVVVIASVNTEVEVLGGTADWYHVKAGEDEGYMASRYLTADKAEAEAAQQKAEEEAAAEAAAQAAAAAAASSGNGGGNGGGGNAGGGNACLTGGVLN